MAVTWVLTTPKGGAGKTTLTLVLAGELARLGRSVEILDADVNAPILMWSSKKRLPSNIRVAAAATAPSELRDQLATAQKRSQYVIIDTEGTNNTLSTFAIAAADLVIVPAQTSPEDVRHAVRAVEFTKDVGQMRGKPIPTVVVMTRTGAIRDSVQRAQERDLSALDTAGRLVLCPVRLAERGACRAMIEEGVTLPQLAGLGDDAGQTIRNITGADQAVQNGAALLRALAECYGTIQAGSKGQGDAA